jgi:hypothetical protein
MCRRLLSNYAYLWINYKYFTDIVGLGTTAEGGRGEEEASMTSSTVEILARLCRRDTLYRILPTLLEHRTTQNWHRKEFSSSTFYIYSGKSSAERKLSTFARKSLDESTANCFSAILSIWASPVMFQEIALHMWHVELLNVKRIWRWLEFHQNTSKYLNPLSFEEKRAILCSPTDALQSDLQDARRLVCSSVSMHFHIVADILRSLLE